MKNLFLTLLSIIALASSSFAQQATTIAKSQPKAELPAAKEKGVFTFTLPSGTTAEDVAKNSTYYVHYFTTAFNAETSQVKITMLTNDDKSRHVIVRFLSASNIQYISVDGTTMVTEEFFNTYLK
jgi:hypothetical protein